MANISDGGERVCQAVSGSACHSPGGFPPEISEETILDRQSPRNRRIAEIFTKSELVERSGQGMNLIYEQSIMDAKPLPDFKGSDEFLVRITFGAALRLDAINCVKVCQEYWNYNDDEIALNAIERN